MTAAYLFFNYDCILVYEMFFEYSVIFIAQIHHYEKFMTLHKLISIVL